MKPDGHLTLSEARHTSGYSATALRKAFDDPDQELTGVRESRNGQQVRFYEEQSLLEWVKSRPQGERKSQRTAVSEPTPSNANNDDRAKKIKSKKRRKKNRVRSEEQSRQVGSTTAELRELIEELRTENEGQAAAIEQLFDSLVHEAESHYKQLVRLAQAHRTSEAAKPGKRRVDDLLRDLNALDDYA